MAYTKTVWQDGDIITAQKMNNIENGIESAGGAKFYIIDIATLLAPEVDNGTRPELESESYDYHVQNGTNWTPPFFEWEYTNNVITDLNNNIPVIVLFKYTDDNIISFGINETFSIISFLPYEDSTDQGGFFLTNNVTGLFFDDGFIALVQPNTAEIIYREPNIT